MSKKIYNSTNILGLNIVSSSYQNLLKMLKNHLFENTQILSVFTPNPEQVVLAKSHKPYEKTLGFADLRIPDGVGLVYGSHFLSFFAKSEKIIGRISGVDVVSDLLVWLQSDEKLAHKKVLLLGGRGYSGLQFNQWAVTEVNVTSDKNPRVEVDSQSKRSSLPVRRLYWYEGYLNVSVPTKQETKNIEAVIKKIQPDIVFVAFGAPHQEEWVQENYNLLKSAGVQLVMVVGGAFDMLLGKLPRAPKWMRKIGLEWLFRLAKEPWRWRRQLKLLKFLKLLVQEVLG